jgi:hypothetical protein
METNLHGIEEIIAGGLFFSFIWLLWNLISKSGDVPDL